MFGRKGAVERRALVRMNETGWVQGSDCIRLRFLTPDIDSLFVSYVLGSPQYRSWIIRNAHGATMPSLNQDIIGRIPLPLPPLPEQRAIARILGSLDDRIELNRRMNATLEAMAQATFRSWFVDFDPVRAKMEGREPAGMDAETAALFPDGFEVVDGREVPVGWEVSTIGVEVQVVGGSTPSTKNPAFWNEGSIPFATPKDMSQLTSPVLLETERYITEAGLNTISSGLLPKGTVLLSSRAPIGYLAIAEVPVAVNQGFIAMVCNKTLSNYYVLHWTQENMEKIKANANGSTFQEISKKNFRPIEVVVPSSRVLERYDGLIRPIYEQITNNVRQSRTLATLRDTLLPKLISGEIRVPVNDIH
ncbi:Type I restriction modification DNA specificity domain protein [anaerobic digester metagenome]